MAVSGAALVYYSTTRMMDVDMTMMGLSVDASGGAIPTIIVGLILMYFGIVRMSVTRRAIRAIMNKKKKKGVSAQSLFSGSMDCNTTDPNDDNESVDDPKESVSLTGEILATIVFGALLLCFGAASMATLGPCEVSVTVLACGMFLLYFGLHTKQTHTVFTLERHRGEGGRLRVPRGVHHRR